MPKIQYDHFGWEPRAASLLQIETANAILADYERQGFRLTLRQLYYQMVAHHGLPNTHRSYKNLGNLVSKARLAGLIDWSAIEDRTRSLEYLPSYEDGADYIVPDGYRSDWWADQPVYVEVWVEKQALAGVLWAVCRQHQVPLFAAKGYPSQSEMWRTARRLADKVLDGKEVIVLHFGDHDPSGIDMTRDLVDRWNTLGAGGIEVRRLALNMDQIEEYDPPPNTAKLTDSRGRKYIAEYGPHAWELDALEPAVLHELVESNIEPLKDLDAWAESELYDEDERETLRLVERHYTEVSEYVRTLDNDEEG